MEKPRPEGTPEQEAMKRPLSMLAEVLDDGHIKGISPEVLVKNNVPESRAREIFDYMKKNGAIGEEGSAEEGYAVDRERLQELIEGAPSKSEKEKTPDVQETIETARKEVGQEIKDGQTAAERAGAVDPASRDSLHEAGGELGKTVEQEAARVAFVEETARIINEKLVASVDFSPEFEPELRDALFERGPEKIRELLNNLRELLRDTPAELGEFAVEIFGDDHVALSPEKKSLEFGIAALGEKVLSKTAQKLERVTKKIVEDHEALRERERLTHEEEIFNREQKAFEAKVARFAILPILKQAAVEAGSAQKFFRSLESALNLGDAAVAQELKSRQVFVIDGDEVSISSQSITIGIGALRPSVVRETARKVRKKITPPAAVAPQQEPPRVEALALKPVAPQEQPAPEVLPPEPKAPADSGTAPNPETPPGGAEVPPSIEPPPVESSDEKKRRWETIFQTAVISDQAEKWIASESGPGEETFTQSVDEFVTLISADPEIVPLLKKYRLYVHSAENSFATKGNIRVSASELMKEGPQAIAYYFNDEIRELEGLVIVPLGRPNQPAGKDDVQGLKKPGERLAEWHLKWEAVFRKVDIATSARIWAESKGSSGVEDLLQSSDELLTLVSADSELLPYLFEYRIFIHGHEGNLLGKGNLSISAPDLLRDGSEATAKLLVAKIRELEGLPPKVAAQEGSAVVPPEVPPTAPAAVRPEREKESIYETVDRLNATYTQFDLTLADATDAERESNVNILRRIEDEIYPIIIPLIERGSRIYLRIGNYSNAFLNSGGRGSQSFASGSTGIEIDKHETNENIIAHIQEFLKHNPQFAVGGRASDGERTRTELAGEDEEAETMSLDEARDAYRMAYAQYQHRNPRRRGSIYGASGDTSALETARARYDAALKIAAERIRKNEHDRVLVPGSVWTPEDATNSANRLIFEELVIAEEKRISDLRIEELQEEEQGFMKRIWLSYARMPRWKKVALSMTIGAGIAGATGGGTAVLFYAGKKAVSFSASAFAGLGTTTAFHAIDRFANKTGTKEYKLEELIDSRRDDISQNLDNMRQEYKALLEQDADRERKRMYLKAGIAAIAGLGAAMELHHLTSVPAPGASTHHEGAPPKATPERIGPTDRPSPLGSPTESQAPSPGVTQSPAHTEPQTEAPRGERPVVEEQPATIPAARPPVTETEPAAPSAEPTHTFKLPEARHDIQKPVELPEAPEATLPPPTPLSTILGPQEPQPDIYDLPLTHPNYGVAGAHLPNPLENPVEPVPPDAFHAATETQETLRRLKQMSADMAANPVPRPPILPPMHPPDTTFPPRPPETVPLTASTEIPHEIVGVRPELGNAPTPEAIQGSIAVWDGKDIAQAAKIAHQVEDVSRLSLQDRSLLVSSLAQKVGDKNWSVNINHFDADAVSRQVKDYLVAYPEAEHLGFHSYSEYAGVKDLSLQKLTEQMPSNLPSALRHSLFHRGAHIEELRNGRIHNVPLKMEHVQLNNALILTTAPAEQSRTVGELLAERAQDVEYQLPKVLQMMRQSLGLSR